MNCKSESLAPPPLVVINDEVDETEPVRIPRDLKEYNKNIRIERGIKEAFIEYLLPNFNHLLLLLKYQILINQNLYCTCSFKKNQSWLGKYQKWEWALI